MEERENLGLSTLYLLGTNFAQVLRSIGKHHVTNWEVFDDGQHRLDKHRVQRLRKAAERQNISYTVHGPICDLNAATLNTSLRPRILERMRESLGNAASLEAESWVLHPGTHGALSWVNKGEDWVVNQSSLRTLQAEAKRLGVLMTIENISAVHAILGRVPDFLRLYSEWKTGPAMTLDLAHSHIKGETETFLKNLTHRVRNVHLSDNNGDIDTHLAVGAGTLNWKRTVRSLVEHGFDGKIIIESVKGPFASLERVGTFLRSLD